MSSRQKRQAFVNQHSIPPAGPRAAIDPANQTRIAPSRPAPAARNSGDAVEQAIAAAARRSTVDFDFLVAQAQVESAMNPSARATTSSATGLYQFIESTWLGTMQRHGSRFGLGDLSAQIGTSPGGAAHVADPARREAILNLRNDPKIAALMAAGLAEDNRAHLAPILGREPDHGELYLAHFLGAGGAGRFLKAMAQDPDQSAAALFRSAAAANPSIFYEPGGAPRSLGNVMDRFNARLERAGADVRNGAPSWPQGHIAALGADPDALRAGAGLAGRAPVDNMRATPVRSTRPSFPDGTIAMAPAASARPMSGLLRDAFAGADRLGSQHSAKQVRGAYEQLRALGL